MDELEKTQQIDPTTAKTAQLPSIEPSANKTPAEKRVEDFRHGQAHILQRLAANAPLSEILHRLVLLIEAQVPDMLCSVLLLSEDGEHVVHGAAPSLPEEYVRAIDGSPIGPKEGSCGTAIYRGEPVFVTDILTDPLWDEYREIAVANGLRACWSTPILSGRGKILGSFAMYYGEPRTPTGAEANLTEVATRIAGLAIEHHAAREMLARTQAQLAQATYAASTGKAAISIIEEVNQQLENVVSNAKKCLELLDEDKPEVASFREPLKNIASSGHNALEVIARIRKSAKK
jgi:GAF domain-containing protein